MNTRTPTHKPGYFLVETPEGDFAFFGVVEADGNHCWLCMTAGAHLVHLPARCITPTSREDVQARLQRNADIQRACAEALKNN